MSIRRRGARETTRGGRERSMIQIARRSGRAGLPIRVAPGSTSRTTTAPMPISDLVPIRSFWRMMAVAPM